MKAGLIAVAALALGALSLTTSAEARRYEGGGYGYEQGTAKRGYRATRAYRNDSEYRSERRYRRHAQRATRAVRAERVKRHRYASYDAPAARHGAGGRPRAWCGWWMRTQRGGGPEMNIARNWSRYGSASSPQVGAVVVWSHHVGEIVGQAANGQWLVRSGNDGGAVRTRARSLAGAIAVRM